MEHGVVPPTINLDNPDLEAGCDLDYVPNVAHKYAQEDIPTAIMSDNLGFGKCVLSLFYLLVLFNYLHYIRRTQCSDHL